MLHSVHRATLLLIAIFCSAILSAQEPQTAPPPNETQTEQGGPDTIGGGLQDPAAVERGRKLFVPTCGFCHGTDARGRSGPDLVRSSIVLHDVKGSLIGQVVRNGRPQQGMPAFGLTPDQIADIAAFLHSRTHGAANRFTYVITGLLTGDPKAGEAFFYGTGKCNACHSPQKDLAHIASKYDPVELQSRLLSPPSPDYPDSFAKEEKPRAAISAPAKLASGASISGTLIDVDAFDVVLIDDSCCYHSYPRGQVQLEIHDPLEAHSQLIPKYSDRDMQNMLAYLETFK
jgi:cytochrome c oxidase cbb3-type subunit III